MGRKKTDTRAEDVERIAEELREDMRKCGVEPDLYNTAVLLSAETLYERERAYCEYVENGATQTNVKGASNPYAVRLQSWNNQARACLTMLRLTPPYKRQQTDTDDADI